MGCVGMVGDGTLQAELDSICHSHSHSKGSNCLQSFKLLCKRMLIFGVPFEGVYDFLNAFPCNLFKDIARTLKGWKFTPCSRSSIFSLRRDNGQEGQAAALTRETCGETIIKIMTVRLFFSPSPPFPAPAPGMQGSEVARKHWRVKRE